MYSVTKYGSTKYGFNRSKTDMENVMNTEISTRSLQ